MKKFISFVVVIAALSSCTGSRFSASDRAIINTDREKLLHVYTVDDAGENAVLRKKSVDMSRRTLLSQDYHILADRMIMTVSDRTVDGVGIAGPQVGINKRIVAVQRFDKPGEPFEVYPNIHIIKYSDEKKCGSEGCLSVPGKRGDVLRSEWVVISYAVPGSRHEAIDTVKGFTAVIFQHETDHLEGIVYTDKIEK